MTYYRQCTLQRDNSTMVGWIEERGAKVGYWVQLEDTTEPERFWKVITVSEARMSQEQVNKNQHLHSKWRESVDI